MLHKESSMYTQVICVSQEYLGAGSKQLIDRQISNHLSKNPEDITGRDLEMLLDWIKAVACMVLEDKQRVQLFVNQLRSMTTHPVV